MPQQPTTALRPLTFVVTVLVAVPLMLAIEGPRPWYVTMAIAAVSLGAGHLASAIHVHRRSPTGPEAVEQLQERRAAAFLDQLDRQPAAPPAEGSGQT